jgi:uncharacterized protein YndB with AHSA1/START domain
MTTEIKNSTPDCEVVATRILNASRELVYKAWTTPEHLKNWWGPNGFTNTFHEFDLQPGGKWIFIMHGPDGKDYLNESVFVKIEEPKRIVFNHISVPQFQIIATFDEAADGKTNVTFRMVFDTAEACAKLRAFVTDKNEENLDRLEDELKRMSPENK